VFSFFPEKRESLPEIMNEMKAAIKGEK